MSVSCIPNNTEHPLFWYRQSHLLIHKSRVFDVNTSIHLADLMLKVVASNNIKVELSYQPIPYSRMRYLMILQCPQIQRQPFLITRNHARALSSQSITFCPMRCSPGKSGYYLIPNIMLIRSWMMKTARERLGKKRLALAMGLHARLGKECPLMELGSDLVWAIVFDFKS
jgi:hypothetical protein